MPAAQERPNLLLPDLQRWPEDPDKPILELKNVSKAFEGKPILKNLSLKVCAGETVVVMGESGSGKTVLLRLMTALDTPDEGEVWLFGKNLAAMPHSEVLAIRKRFGMLFQNYALMDSLRVHENIAFSLKQNARLPSDDIDRRVRDLLNMLDLPHAYDKFPSELSGGMKKRVSLARGLITQPELFFFDEPTTGLDPIMIEFVDQLIIRAQQTYKLTSVIISHDVGSVARLATRVAMLQDGHIVQEGTFDEIRQSTHPWVHGFVNVGGSGRMTQGGGDVAEAEVIGDDDATRPVDASGLEAHMAASEGGDAQKRETRVGVRAAAVIPAQPRVTCDDVLERLKGEEDEAVVELVNVHKAFGPHKVLKGVHLKAPKEKITVIIGGSGSGKSVIIKHIIGLFKPDMGSIKVMGREMATASKRDLKSIRENFGMLFQGAALFDSMTVFDNVAFPLFERKIAKGEALRSRVQDILERLYIPDLAHRFPAEISNGQRKRVALARALITNPKVMIYDEPTTGQDPVMIRNVDNMIVEIQENFNITSIVISHDMVSTFRVADRVAMLYQGEILAYGSPDELKESQRDKVQEFIFAGSM